MSLLGSLIGPLLTAIQTPLLASYEHNAADRANRFTAQQNQAAMNFSAQQAAIDRAFQQQSAQRAMQFEADQTAINREWLTEMSNTAYSRAMADMKNAGVNPLLAVAGGQSSTPSTGVASGFSSAGSTASGFSGSGQKANISGIINSITSIVNQQSANSAKIVSSAIGALSGLV